MCIVRRVRGGEATRKDQCIDVQPIALAHYFSLALVGALLRWMLDNSFSTAYGSKIVGAICLSSVEMSAYYFRGAFLITTDHLFSVSLCAVYFYFAPPL